MRKGYRVGEPQETNAYKVIEFEVVELGNTHLLLDLAQALGSEPNLESVRKSIDRQMGSDAKAMWLCDTPEWAEKRYGPGEAYSVDIPEGAVLGSDLGPDGKLWIWKQLTTLEDIANEVPDVDDPTEINYWKKAGDKIYYVEGWCDQCFAGTGLGEYEAQAKIDYARDLTPKILADKAKERGLELLEGDFIETPEKDFIHGVTIGVFKRARTVKEV